MNVFENFTFKIQPLVTALNDFIKKTRMQYMISSPVMPTVSWAEIWEFFKSQRDIIDAVTITKIIVFDIICCVYYYSAANFKLPILQLSNMAARGGVKRSSKSKVKPNLGCRSNIAIINSYISVFVWSWYS